MELENLNGKKKEEQWLRERQWESEQYHKELELCSRQVESRSQQQQQQIAFTKNNNENRNYV